MKNATVLPAAPDPVTARPAKMAFDEYKKLRTSVNKAIKERLQKGFLVFKSQGLILDKQGRPVSKAFKVGRTHVGTTRFLQLV
jgi:hypothetical protein